MRDAKACDVLAGYIDAGIVVAKDGARAGALWAAAAKAFASACDHGDYRACRDAELVVRRGRGVPRDEAAFTALTPRRSPSTSGRVLPAISTRAKAS